DGARVHGAVLPTADLRTVVRSLATANLAARRQTPGLQAERADIIVAGGFIALALLSRLGAGHVRISDRGVRWGLALELA
ncbi:MAG TPA: Ppx/GppA family phosphatase, partial [Terriglobia bacterium]|nr:Ppx/GppA family phosphatase [Terriglobia bacterium]